MFSKFASLVIAFLIFASTRYESDRFALVKLVPCRFASSRNAFLKFAPSKLSLLKVEWISCFWVDDYSGEGFVSPNP